MGLANEKQIHVGYFRQVMTHFQMYIYEYKPSLKPNTHYQKRKSHNSNF